MNLLIEQSEGSFGPFQVPVATVRGNIFDVTGIDNLNQFDNLRDRMEPFGPKEKNWSEEEKEGIIRFLKTHHSVPIKVLEMVHSAEKYPDTK